MYALDVVYRAHVGDGRDFFGVGLDAVLRNSVSKQLPLWNLRRFANVAAKFVIRSQG